MLTTLVGRITPPRVSRWPVTDSTDPTPLPVQNGRAASCWLRPSSLSIPALREHTNVSRLALTPASAGLAPPAIWAGSPGVSTTLSGPRLLPPLDIGSYPTPA